MKGCLFLPAWIRIEKTKEEIFSCDELQGALKNKYVFLIIHNISKNLYDELVDYIEAENPTLVTIYDTENKIREKYPSKSKFFPEEVDTPWLPVRIRDISEHGEIKIAGSHIMSDRTVVAFTTREDKIVLPREIAEFVFRYESINDIGKKIMFQFYRPDFIIFEVNIGEEHYYVVSDNQALSELVEVALYRIHKIKDKKIESIQFEWPESYIMYGSDDVVREIKAIIKRLVEGANE